MVENGTKTKSPNEHVVENGTKAESPNDVHERLTEDSWHQSMESITIFKPNGTCKKRSCQGRTSD